MLTSTHRIIILIIHVVQQCKLGTIVSIRVGGDFFLDTDDDKDIAGKKILLIGGGVGINPLLSIITQRRDCSNKSVDGKMVEKTCLMYSAKTKAELLFMVNSKSLRSTDYDRISISEFIKPI